MTGIGWRLALVGALVVVLGAPGGVAARSAPEPAGTSVLDASEHALFLPIALRGVPSGENVPAPSATPTEPGTEEPTAAPPTPAPTLVPPVPGGPEVGPRLFKSGPIQITADGRWVWVAVDPADAVSRIDATDGTVTTFPLPDPETRDAPRGLSVTEDGNEVWVASHDSDRVYVLDAATGAVRATVVLPWGSGPVSVALSRPGTDGRQRWALVALHRSSSLAAIDTATRAVTLLGPVFTSPHGIVWTEDGSSAWVTHLFVEDEHPSLTRVDASGATPRVSTRIMTGAATPRHSRALHDADPSRNVAEGGYLNFRGHPAQLPSSTGKGQVWLPTQYHNMTEDGVSAASTIQVSLRKLELGRRAVSGDDKVVLTARHVHDPTRGDANPPWLGYGWDARISGAVDLGFARGAGRLYGLVVGEQSGTLVAFPWDTPPVRSKTDPDAPGLQWTRVGERPLGLAVSPAAPVAFVYNALTFDVSVVGLDEPAQPTELRRIPVAAPLATNALADSRLRRGAQLFFTSADPRVSSNGKVSCASCHLNGEHDGRTWALEHLPPGTNGQPHGPRSTINLLGIARTFTNGQRHATFGWGQLHHSGDRDEIQDFEHTFTGPQMGGIGFLGAAAQPELGPSNGGLDRDLDAIADYLLSQPPLARSPARGADGRLTEAALRGAAMFVGDDPDGKKADATCASCHRPEMGFVDLDFHDIGARRPASEAELGDARRRACPWCVNTPTLVGLWATAGYDGSWQWPETFVDVLRDYGYTASGRPAAHSHLAELTGRQLADLAAFVLSIDGDLTATEVRAARDTLPPRIVRVAPASLTRVDVWFSETVDPATAANAASYRIVDAATGASMPVTAATWDPAQGDRVTLETRLVARCPGVTYRLEPAGVVRDAADASTGGVANALDLGDVANRHTFTLADRLTVTLGAGGEANLPVPVHDASPVGPGLSTWSHDRVQLYGQGAAGQPGFVRFAWREAFTAATGVTDPAAILEARFSILPEVGDAQPIEIRRALQPWSDPPAGADWNSNPTGGPTWRDHAHPDAPWNRPGAQALGGTGAARADYGGAYDLADAVDATSPMTSLTERVSFEGPQVTAAYRFWFANPDLDYGYALRLAGAPPAAPSVLFNRWESGLHDAGPELEITYRLPGVAGCQ